MTVVSRLRPLYEAPGVRVGSFIIRPNLQETTGYNDNVLGVRGGPGSWFMQTAPAISANSDWSRNRLGASVSLNNLRYLDTPSQSTTDWTVGVGGGYTIGRSELTLGYSHLSLYESPTDISAPQSQTPIPYDVNDFRSDYTFDLGRLKLRQISSFRHTASAIRQSMA